MRVILLCAALTIASSAFAQGGNKELVGLWKLESWQNEVKATGEKKNLWGEKPKGYIYYSPAGRILTFLAADNRPKPKTDADFAAAMRSMYAISGIYTIKGNSYTVKGDVLWNENQPATWEREFKLEGNKLTIVTPWAPSTVLPGNPETRSITVYTRAK